MWRGLIGTTEVELKIGTDRELLQTYQGRKRDGYVTASVQADNHGAHPELVVTSNYKKTEKGYS